MLSCRAIRKHYAGTNIVMVAQRVSSLMGLDHILVLEDGEAIGYGRRKKQCQQHKGAVLPQITPKTKQRPPDILSLCRRSAGRWRGRCATMCSINFCHFRLDILIHIYPGI